MTEWAQKRYLEILDGNVKDVEISVPLNYLSEINLLLNWSENCVSSSATRATTFTITDTKTLCSCCNFIESRQYKTIDKTRIRF